MNLFKSLISYIFPIVIDTRIGSISPYLEVVGSNGQHVLNSKNANYSYGGCYKIFDALFKKIKIKNFEIKNVLILGMGGGSIINLLKVKYNIDCEITAVEKDQVVIEFAEKYFDIRNYTSLKIISEDAFIYVATTDKKYDLIITDIFIEQNVPEIFASKEYLENLKRISSDKSCIIYNKMTEHPIHKKEGVKLMQSLGQIFSKIEIIKLYINNSENTIFYFNSLDEMEHPNSILHLKRKDLSIQIEPKLY